MTKAVVAKQQSSYAWDRGNSPRSYPQPAGLWLPSGHYQPAKFPFQNTAGQVDTQICPRPDSELPAYSPYKLAFYNGTLAMMWRRRLGVRGGAWPFNYEMKDGPSGMTMGATQWTKGWTVAQAKAAGYGYVQWTPAAAISVSSPQRVWWRVWDQEGNYNDLIWYIATVAGYYYDATTPTNSYGYVFEDYVNGVDPGSYPSTTGVIDTSASPVKTFEWAFGGYPNAIIVPRGTGTIELKTTSNMGTSSGPIAIVGFPGENAHYDASNMTVPGYSKARAFLVNGSDTFAQDITGNSRPLSNVATISVTTVPPGTLTNGTYNNVALTGGTGSGATANITVASGTIVASGVIFTVGGTGYAVNDVLTIPQAAITGATGNGALTVTNIGQQMFRHFDCESPLSRFTAQDCSFPNVMVGTSPTDNPGPFFFDDPSSGAYLRQYIAFLGISSEVTGAIDSFGSNGFGGYDLYKCQYVLVELCQMTNIPGTAGDIKESCPDVTIRANLMTSNTTTSANGILMSSLGVVTSSGGAGNHNHEYCWNVFDGGTVALALDWNDWGIASNEFGPVYSYRNSFINQLAIKTPAGNGLFYSENDAIQYGTANSAPVVAKGTQTLPANTTVTGTISAASGMFNSDYTFTVTYAANTGLQGAIVE